MKLHISANTRLPRTTSTIHGRGRCSPLQCSGAARCARGHDALQHLAVPGLHAVEDCAAAGHASQHPCLEVLRDLQDAVPPAERHAGSDGQDHCCPVHAQAPAQHLGLAFALLLVAQPRQLRGRQGVECFGAAPTLVAPQSASVAVVKPWLRAQACGRDSNTCTTRIASSIAPSTCINGCFCADISFAASANRNKLHVDTPEALMPPSRESIGRDRAGDQSLLTAIS